MLFMEVFFAIICSIGYLALFLFGLSLAGLGGGCAFFLLAGHIGGDRIVFSVIALLFVYVGINLCVMSGTKLWQHVKEVVDAKRGRG